jgi:hypothetical protein
MVVLAAILIARGLHPHHRIRLAVQAEGGANDLSISSQLQPKLVGQDHHVFMARLPFLGQEITTQEQRLALHL